MIGRPPVALVYLGVAILSGVSAIDASVRNATVPRLVGRERLAPALTLNQVVMNATALLGPAVAGIVIERFGLRVAYGLDLASSIAMFSIVWSIRPVPVERDGRPQRGLAAVADGFRYLRRRRVLQAAFGADLVAMIFGMPRALFPLIAVTRFGEGAAAVGFLFAAPALGAVVGALTGGWVRRIRHQGQAVLWAITAWGAAIAAFGLAEQLWMAVLLLACAGAADVISAIFRGTIIQLSVPDELRGRLSSINYLVVAGGPRLGDLEAGLVGVDLGGDRVRGFRRLDVHRWRGSHRLARAFIP